MNWGWDGSCDGYFYDNNLSVNRTDGRGYLNKAHKDIIGIMPN